MLTSKNSDYTYKTVASRDIDWMGDVTMDVVVSGCCFGRPILRKVGPCKRLAR